MDLQPGNFVAIPHAADIGGLADGWMTAWRSASDWHCSTRHTGWVVEMAYEVMACYYPMRCSFCDVDTEYIADHLSSKNHHKRLRLAFPPLPTLGP